MAKLARKIGGSLDAVMAMTGHKDIKLADHYSKLTKDDQKEISLKVAHVIKSQRSKKISVNNLIPFEKKLRLITNEANI